MRTANCDVTNAHPSGMFSVYSLTYPHEKVAGALSRCKQIKDSADPESQGIQCSFDNNQQGCRKPVRPGDCIILYI